MKKVMLQNALNGLKIFRDVKTAEQLEIAKGQGPISYQAYTSLIQQVAASYDKTLEPHHRHPHVGPRQANVMEQDIYDWYDEMTVTYMGRKKLMVKMITLAQCMSMSLASRVEDQTTTTSAHPYQKLSGRSSHGMIRWPGIVFRIRPLLCSVGVLRYKSGRSFNLYLSDALNRLP